MCHHHSYFPAAPVSGCGISGEVIGLQHFSTSQPFSNKGRHFLLSPKRRKWPKKSSPTARLHAVGSSSTGTCFEVSLEICINIHHGIAFPAKSPKFKIQTVSIEYIIYSTS